MVDRCCVVCLGRGNERLACWKACTVLCWDCNGCPLTMFGNPWVRGVCDRKYIALPLGTCCIIAPGASVCQGAGGLAGGSVPFMHVFLSEGCSRCTGGGPWGPYHMGCSMCTC